MNDWPLFAIAAVGLSIGACSGPSAATPPRASPPVSRAATTDSPRETHTTTLSKTAIPYAEAEPLLAAHGPHLHAGFETQPPSGLQAAWAAWIAERDAEIRARLEHGDEDSIINLWYFGTSFTVLPRATPHELATAGPGAARLLEGRLGDLLEAAASPGENERLQFVRQIMMRRGIDLSSETGQQQAWKYIVQIKDRIARENRTYLSAIASAKAVAERAARAGSDNRNGMLSALSVLYRDRGLSSDTSIAAHFALDRALSEMKSNGRLGHGQVHRVAIVGPGLDFSDKSEGYDFYPVQTIQPFAVVDSLVQLQVAAPDLSVTTLDVNARVNDHLTAARRRALAGIGYMLQLPLEANRLERHWNPELEHYWKQLGSRIGDESSPIRPRADLSNVRVRAVRIRPSVVEMVRPVDLNIVLERLNQPPDAGPFDLVVATNVLVYYGSLDQALALSNIAKMLKSGGHFLTNYSVPPPPSFESHPVQSTSVYFDQQKNGDTVFVYVRK